MADIGNTLTESPRKYKNNNLTENKGAAGSYRAGSGSTAFNASIPEVAGGAPYSAIADHTTRDLVVRH